MTTIMMINKLAMTVLRTFIYNSIADDMIIAMKIPSTIMGLVLCFLTREGFL